MRRRGYKTPGEESPSRLQYHSQSSRGSREARPAGRLETAEFLRMALDVLGPSIWGSWETDRGTAEEEVSIEKKSPIRQSETHSSQFLSSISMSLKRRHFYKEDWFKLISAQVPDTKLSYFILQKCRMTEVSEGCLQGPGEDADPLPGTWALAALALALAPLQRCCTLN